MGKLARSTLNFMAVSDEITGAECRKGRVRMTCDMYRKRLYQQIGRSPAERSSGGAFKFLVAPSKRKLHVMSENDTVVNVSRQLLAWCTSKVVKVSVRWKMSLPDRNGRIQNRFTRWMTSGVLPLSKQRVRFTRTLFWIGGPDGRKKHSCGFFTMAKTALCTNLRTSCSGQKKCLKCPNGSRMTTEQVNFLPPFTSFYNKNDKKILQCKLLSHIKPQEKILKVVERIPLIFRQMETHEESSHTTDKSHRTGTWMVLNPTECLTSDPVQRPSRSRGLVEFFFLIAISNNQIRV